MKFQLVISLVVVSSIVVSGCPFLRQHGDSVEAAKLEDNPHRRKLQSKPKPPPRTVIPTRVPTAAPSFLPTIYESPGPSLGFCQKSALPVTKENICAAYNSIKPEFEAATSVLSTRSSVYGAAVRLAFHDAGEVDLGTLDLMGPDGCLSQTASNAGLIEATSVVNTVMEPIWQSYCDKISRADFWALFAKLAVEKADPTDSINIPFQYGRVDNVECSDGAGRLPSAGMGLPEFNRVFVTQMGLTLHDAVALLGAHTLGHVHIEHSGFGQLASDFPNAPADLINSWDNTPSQFDNHYYQNLADRNWRNALTTTAGLNEWHGPGASVMLNADMAMAFNPNLDNGQGIVDQLCGPTAIAGSVYGCARPQDATVPTTAAQVQQYLLHNDVFLSDFSESFAKMTTVGYGLDGTTTGKLGSLTSIDLTTC